ncbi:hypothetical protein CRG98_043581 [Punica granatum]|uniref:Uncharacterized protein n=1 Tax=Punica granatum TaxID=22663 RepID=A0A2I0HXM4_PUNGR|nr:hypothetical protein CRG98_043581 [Punica granatum]
MDREREIEFAGVDGKVTRIRVGLEADGKEQDTEPRRLSEAIVKRERERARVVEVWSRSEHGRFQAPDLPERNKKKKGKRRLLVMVTDAGSRSAESMGIYSLQKKQSVGSYG